jgi:hypothetical protein
VTNAMFAKNAGHQNPDRYAKEARQRESNGRPPRLKCFRCQKPGHRASYCFAPAPIPVAEKAGQVEESAFYNSVENANEGSTNSWCLDSGATSHMTAEKRHLRNFNRTSKSLRLANN